MPLPRVYLAYRIPTYGTFPFDALEVAADLLTTGRASRMYANLVRANQVAQDVAAHGVTCNAVLPGWVRGTGMSDRTMALAAEREGISVAEVWAKIEADSVAGRVVEPGEVADAIAYLSS